MDEGLPLSEFLIQELASQVDMETIDGRARLAELAKAVAGDKFRAGVYRELLIGQAGSHRLACNGTASSMRMLGEWLGRQAGRTQPAAVKYCDFARQYSRRLQHMAKSIRSCSAQSRSCC